MDLIEKIAAHRGTTIEHEIAHHNVGVTERHRESGRPLPGARNPNATTSRSPASFSPMTLAKRIGVETAISCGVSVGTSD